MVFAVYKCIHMYVFISPLNVNNNRNKNILCLLNIPKCSTHTYSLNLTAALGSEGQMNQLYIKCAPSVISWSNEL